MQQNQNSNPYTIAYESACNPETRENFWREQSSLVDWFSPPQNILDKSNPNPGFWRWFSDAKLNMSYNCIDRHLIDIPNNPALITYSSYTKKDQVYTYQQLHAEVSKLAGVYKKLGVKKGDRIIIYMPMVAEAVFGMLASARIGAIHSVVFGGFSAHELSGRIRDSNPSLILTASCGVEPHKYIDYKDILDEALQKADRKDNIKVLLLQRQPHFTQKIVPGRDLDYHTCLHFAEPADCEVVGGSDPLYILYTSGTTGAPKGIVRDNGGTAVATSWTMKHIMDIHKGDVYFSGSDIGWVVGHHFIVYGPLLRGATTILFEGKPTYPDPGQYWQIIEKFKVKGLYTAPTALRAIRKEDPEGQWISKYDISSLQGVSMAGERCDVPTYEWIQSHLKVFINDNYWQTEIGWIISCNYKNLHTFPIKPGSAIKPAPGFIVNILDSNNQVINEPDKLGKLCIKLPMPPSFMLTLYNNDEAFVQKYLTEAPGYYQSGDCGYFDQDGYLNVMTRLDDVINTAGHRLSTAQMEECLLTHHSIVEAAVVAKKDSFKGEVPVGFVVVKEGCHTDKRTLEKDCLNIIRKLIGPVASFQNCLVVDKLPKTRSGKILRYTLKRMIDGLPIESIPSTIEDANVLNVIKQNILDYNGFKNETETLVYRDQIDKVQGDFAQLVEEN